MMQECEGGGVPRVDLIKHDKHIQELVNTGWIHQAGDFLFAGPYTIAQLRSRMTESCQSCQTALFSVGRYGVPLSLPDTRCRCTAAERAARMFAVPAPASSRTVPRAWPPGFRSPTAFPSWVSALRGSRLLVLLVLVLLLALQPTTTTTTSNHSLHVHRYRHQTPRWALPRASPLRFWPLGRAASAYACIPRGRSSPTSAVGLTSSTRS